MNTDKTNRLANAGRSAGVVSEDEIDHASTHTASGVRMVDLILAHRAETR